MDVDPAACRVLAKFRAGRAKLEERTIKPDTRKGLLRVIQVREDAFSTASENFPARTAAMAMWRQAARLPRRHVYRLCADPTLCNCRRSCIAITM